MKYRILLFDLDDTLLDFAANEAVSLKTLFERHGIALTDEVFQVYNAVNKQLWIDYENGRIELDKVLNTRFSETLLRLGKAVDGAEWESVYRELLGNGSQLIDGALELCQRLSVSHRLFAITNGVAETQMRRLKLSGLLPYFEGIFDSQSIGYQKPLKEFFDYVMGHIRDFNKKEALIIGDSLSTDIKGGIISGIDTCWINRHSRERAADIPSTYMVASLAELYDICTL
jgi:2-haloacid dehalogenase